MFLFKKLKVIRLNDLIRRSQFVIVFIPKFDFLDNLSEFSPTNNTALPYVSQLFCSRLLL